MNRLDRFSDCIAKFCKETGKPGPCADPNSKRQQRLKGLGAKAKAAPVAKAKASPSVGDQLRDLHDNLQGVRQEDIGAKVEAVGAKLDTKKAREAAANLGIYTADGASKKAILSAITKRISDRKIAHDRRLKYQKSDATPDPNQIPAKQQRPRPESKSNGGQGATRLAQIVAALNR